MSLKNPKVIESKGSDSEVSSTIDLGLAEIGGQRAAKAKARRNAGAFAVEEILDSVTSQKSPVLGESWPALKKGNYKNFKKAEVGNTRANMELTGAMLDALDWKPTPEGIKVGIFDNDQAPKADGHNRMSGRATRMPKRRFLAKDGQKFDFQSDLKSLVSEALVSEKRFRKAEFDAVSSTASLFRVLRPKFPDLSEREIESAILRTPTLSVFFERFDLLRFFRGQSKS